MDQVQIGLFIVELRKEQGLTQQQLAERLGISNKTVSKWETGKGLPVVGLMLPLGGLLGMIVPVIMLMVSFLSCTNLAAGIVGWCFAREQIICR